MDAVVQTGSRSGLDELPMAVALYESWLPITDEQRDGSWIWALAQGRNYASGEPFEATLVRWEKGRWFEHGDREGCDDQLWTLTHYLPLPAPTTPKS